MQKIDLRVKDATSGPWSIETFKIGKAGAWKFNASVEARGMPPYHQVVPGTYKRLVHKDRGVVMSNTPMEIHTNLDFINRAKGRVLVNGLGLGMVLTEIFKKTEVEHVTVVERDSDVIALTAPYFEWEILNNKLTIIQADCLERLVKRGEQYDAVWHDIWDDINDLNLLEMEALKKKFKRHTKWQGCWAEPDCQAMKEKLAMMCLASGKTYAGYLQHLRNKGELKCY